MLLQESQADFPQQVLRTDVAGMPLEWVNYQDAVRMYHLGQVAYSCGVMESRHDQSRLLQARFCRRPRRGDAPRAASQARGL